jgi:hypothetical protein
VDAFQVASPGDLPSYPFRFKFHIAAPLKCGLIAGKVFLTYRDTILSFVTNFKIIAIWKCRAFQWDGLTIRPVVEVSFG